MNSAVEQSEHIDEHSDSADIVRSSSRRLTVLTFAAAAAFVRCIIAGAVGFLVGGASGWSTSYIFFHTPLQRVFGPRFTDFDFMGAIAVTVLAAISSGVAAAVGAAGSHERIRSTFEARNLLTLVFAPALVIAVLSLTVSGEWAWLGLIHLSTCAGVLAGTGCALFIRRTAKSKPDHGVN